MISISRDRLVVLPQVASPSGIAGNCEAGWRTLWARLVFFSVRVRCTFFSFCVQRFVPGSRAPVRSKSLGSFMRLRTPSTTCAAAFPRVVHPSMRLTS